jgi:hypothetical protein
LSQKSEIARGGEFFFCEVDVGAKKKKNQLSLIFALEGTFCPKTFFFLQKSKIIVIPGPRFWVFRIERYYLIVKEAGKNSKNSPKVVKSGQHFFSEIISYVPPTYFFVMKIGQKKVS